MSEPCPYPGDACRATVLLQFGGNAPNSPVCGQLLEQQIRALSWRLGEVFTSEALLELGLQQ